MSMKKTKFNKERKIDTAKCNSLLPSFDCWTEYSSKIYYKDFYETGIITGEIIFLIKEIDIHGFYF